MYAYKGVDSKMSTSCGGGFSFKLNKWYKEDEAQTARCGFHCAFEPFICFSYFSPCHNNRFFLVEIGEYDEDDSSRISAKEIRFIKELSVIEMVAEEIRYAIAHPKVTLLQPYNEKIKFVRGKSPETWANKGEIVALLKEFPDNENIKEVMLIEVDGKTYKEGNYSL